MNAQEIQALIAAARAGGGGGKTKLDRLEVNSPSEWSDWRQHFETICTINDWADLRRRREMKAAMRGDAAQLISDIAVEDEAGVNRTIDTVLTLYQNRFCPAAASQIAIVEFHHAGQRPDETVSQFHGRLRKLFVRAYPDQAAGANDSKLLIQIFAMGMVDQGISRHILDNSPATYTAASELAQLKYATEVALQGNKTSSRRHVNQLGREPQANQVGRNENGLGRCWYCGAEGHRRNDCGAFKKAEEYFKGKSQTSSRSGGSSGRNRGGRGPSQRGRTGRGSTGSTRPRVNHMDSPSQNQPDDGWIEGTDAVSEN